MLRFDCSVPHDLLCDVWCLLFAMCSLLFVVWCLVGCYQLVGRRALLVAGWLLCVACCLCFAVFFELSLFVACCCLLFEGCSSLFVAWCLLFVVNCSVLVLRLTLLVA